MTYFNLQPTEKKGSTCPSVHWLVGPKNFNQKSNLVYVNPNVLFLAATQQLVEVSCLCVSQSFGPKNVNQKCYLVQLIPIVLFLSVNFRQLDVLMSLCCLVPKISTKNLLQVNTNDLFLAANQRLVPVLMSAPPLFGWSQTFQPKI